jgi:hypothetical protein
MKRQQPFSIEVVLSSMIWSTRATLATLMLVPERCTRMSLGYFLFFLLHETRQRIAR